VVERFLRNHRLKSPALHEHPGRGAGSSKVPFIKLNSVLSKDGSIFVLKGMRVVMVLLSDFVLKTMW
jgi:hypothetical protein